MKKILYLSFIILITIAACKENSPSPSPPQPKVPVLEVTYFFSHNWMVGSGVDFQVRLKNSGQASATDIILQFNYRAVNNSLSYLDSVTNVQWVDTIKPAGEQFKTFSYNLQSGYYVDSANVTIVSYQ
jgi:hypothetical protein